jgi:RimJ/RimL family protein N-acetyltransferase
VRLETARLILRAHRPDDFEAHFAMWADPLVYRFITGKPGTREECWSRMLRYAGHWNWFGHGFWAVEDKSTGAFIGELGFADFHRDIEPPLNGRPEMGWVFASGYHGKGYGSEAAIAAAVWGDTHLASRETICIMAPENLASLRIAEKIGFRKSHETTYHGEPTLVLCRTRG